MVSIFAKRATFARAGTFVKRGASARVLVAVTWAISAAHFTSAKFGAVANGLALVRAEPRKQPALALVRVVVFLALVGSA